MTFAQIIEYAKRGIFTLLGLFLALYLFVILMTYTANDPSWSHISSDMTHINNMGGAMGAWLSDLLYVFFGWGAWWLFAFLVYESVLIWWDNKPTFGPLRVIAYIFLLLAGSALLTQIFALFQDTTAGNRVEGMAGGVVGQELSTRLSLLMTSLGSLLFLLVFVLITATFAFNIHWKVLASKIASRAWLGSGVKRDNDMTNYDDPQTQSTYQAGDGSDEWSDDSVREEADRYGQLPLPLQAASHLEDDDFDTHADTTHTSHQSGHNSRHNTRHDPRHAAGLTNVLNEFLVKSGLGASLQQQLAAEKQAQSQSHDSDQNDSEADYTQAPVVAMTPVAMTHSATKVEPSFDWNDEQAVSSLLEAEQTKPVNTPVTEHTTIKPAEGERVIEVQAPSDDTNSQQPMQDVPVTSDAKPTQQSGITPAPAQATARDEHNHDNIDEISVDELADAWLATTEHEALPVNWEAGKPKLNIIDNGSIRPNEPQLAATEETPITPNFTEDKPQPSAAHLGGGIDLTPTNTPPADPTQPPSSNLSGDVSSNMSSNVSSNISSNIKAVDKVNAEDEHVDQVGSPSVSTSSQATPNIRFAVPEGNASNHIEDMVPDSDEVYLPPIEDDEAYASRSRAMQTAKYRESLTPIPEISILDKPDPDRKPSYTVAELEQLSELLEIKLQEFNVKAEVKNAIPGPVVTRFEVELAAGVKASKVTGISRDLARSLSMASLRVVEVIPGKPYIGIEVPNKKREMVRLIELLSTEQYKDPKAQISMAMGKDIGGNPIITDLARAPHMLVAGTTGSGKSVLVNSMLLSMLLKYKPDELRLILIDPKQLELANYNDIPHLLTPVVTDMTEAASSLSWCVAEMERRYQLMSLLKVRKLGEFNKKVIAAEKAGRPIIDPLWRPNDSVSISQAPKLKTLPMIVIVADEFADMIMQVGKQAEELITRLAQKSRAAGIHLMLATQRPSVDVITGLIKANIPVRAALRVNSKVDSRTILDAGGAEDMLGNGDMLFLGPGQIEPERVHGAYVSDEEVNRVCDAWRERGAPDYIDNMASNFELTSPGDSGGNTSGEDDALYDEAVAFVMETRKVSASSIQRKFSIGYNRAARIVDSMEEAGLVSSMGKSGKRELLM